MKKKKTQVDESEEMENFIDVIKRNCKKYPQFKALLKLMGWGVFFLIIFFLFIISKIKTNRIENNRNNKETTTTQAVIDDKESYKDIINKLLKDNVKYKYDITIDNKTYSITGELNNNILDGYYENEDGTSHFRIKDEVSYVVKGSKEEQNDNLFNGLDNTFIYPSKLVYLLTNNLSTKISNDGVNKHEYKDIKVGDKTYQILVVDDSSRINKIEIIDNNNSYIISVK